MKLLRVVKAAPSSRQKFVAVFQRADGSVKRQAFGARGMNDYTLTGDKDARERYRQRHKRDLATKDPTRAGYLSYYILWGESKSMAANIRAYKRRFGL